MLSDCKNEERTQHQLGMVKEMKGLTLEQVEKYLETADTLEYTKVFETKRGFGAASFGQLRPNVTLFFDNGEELAEDKRPWSPFNRESFDPLDMNLFDNIKRCQFLEALRAAFPTTPFQESRYAFTRRNGVGAVNLPSLADKALFCQASKSRTGNPCLTPCDAYEATHLFVALKVDYRRDKNKTAEIQRQPEVFYFRYTADRDAKEEFWVLNLSDTPETQRLREELAYRWSRRQTNLGLCREARQSAEARPGLESRFQQIKCSLDQARIAQPDNWRLKLLDGDDYFAFGGKNFVFSAEDLTRAEALAAELTAPAC